MYRSDKQFMKNPATLASRIFVGNLPDNLVPLDLEGKFGKHGNILGLNLQRGFAFIQYETDSHARSAIEKDDGSIFHGRKINVRQAYDKKNPNQKQPARPPSNQQFNQKNQQQFSQPNQQQYNQQNQQQYNQQNQPQWNKKNQNNQQYQKQWNQQQEWNQQSQKQQPQRQQEWNQQPLNQKDWNQKTQKQQEWSSQSQKQQDRNQQPQQQQQKQQQQQQEWNSQSQKQQDRNQQPLQYQEEQWHENEQQWNEEPSEEKIGSGLLPSLMQTGSHQQFSEESIEKQSNTDQKSEKDFDKSFEFNAVQQHENFDEQREELSPEEDFTEDPYPVEGNENFDRPWNKSNESYLQNQFTPKEQNESTYFQNKFIPKEQNEGTYSPNKFINKDQNDSTFSPNKFIPKDQNESSFSPNKFNNKDRDNKFQQGNRSNVPFNKKKFPPRERDDMHNKKFPVRGTIQERFDNRFGPQDKEEENFPLNKFGSRDREDERRNDQLDQFGPQNRRSRKRKPFNTDFGTPQDNFRDAPCPPFYGRDDSYPPSQSYIPPPGAEVPLPPERNDCEIIVVSKMLTDYAEFIEQRLKSLGLIVDLLFPNEDVPIGRVLANISSRGCLFAILIMPQNEENRSLTLNILHGIPQEHRNMPVEDAMKLISRNFDVYMRGDKTFPPNGTSNTKMCLNDRHPEQIQILFNLLAENRQLTVVQYDKVLKYLEERKDLQSQYEINESDETAGEPETDAKATELQNRILNILNKSGRQTESPQPVGAPVESVKPTPLLNDPSVQKALDSLLSGDMFKSEKTSS